MSTLLKYELMPRLQTKWLGNCDHNTQINFGTNYRASNIHLIFSKDSYFAFLPELQWELSASEPLPRLSFLPFFRDVTTIQGYFETQKSCDSLPTCVYLTTPMPLSIHAPLDTGQQGFGVSLNITTQYFPKSHSASIEIPKILKGIS